METPSPSEVPTEAPTEAPSEAPSSTPSSAPSEKASQIASAIPSLSEILTEAPSITPSVILSPSETKAPTPCAPLNPNPDSFEDGTDFPSSPWSTYGDDGAWAVSADKAFNGTHSLKSPDLEDTPSLSVSNATLILCDDFEGGTFLMKVWASVQPPWDIFVVYRDGEVAGQLVDVNEWADFGLTLEPGPHRIDFSYRYNQFGLPNFPPSPPTREGEYW